MTIAGRPDLAWEVIFVPGARAGEPPRVLFAGTTGYVTGQEGERRGTFVQVVPRDDRSSYLVIGEMHEDERICGQTTTLLEPRVVDPTTLTLRRATMQRLGRDERGRAIAVPASARSATATDEAPLAPLLVATGTSTSRADALTDGDARTVWTAERAGDGRGEFVLMRAPAEVALTRFVLVPVPARRPGEKNAATVAPSLVYVVTDAVTLAVTLPADATAHPGATYDVPLAEPIHTACVALVLGETSVAAGAHVGVAELTAYGEFDGQPASKIAEALAGGGARANAAAAMLKRSGGRGLAAVGDRVGPAGRSRARSRSTWRRACLARRRGLCSRGQRPTRTRSQLDGRARSWNGAASARRRRCWRRWPTQRWRRRWRRSRRRWRRPRRCARWPRRWDAATRLREERSAVRSRGRRGGRRPRSWRRSWPTRRARKRPRRGAGSGAGLERAARRFRDRSARRWAGCWPTQTRGGAIFAGGTAGGARAGARRVGEAAFASLFADRDPMVRAGGGARRGHRRGARRTGARDDGPGAARAGSRARDDGGSARQSTRDAATHALAASLTEDPWTIRASRGSGWRSRRVARPGRDRRRARPRPERRGAAGASCRAGRGSAAHRATRFASKACASELMGRA